jgi:hypothetical protein
LELIKPKPQNWNVEYSQNIIYYRKSKTTVGDCLEHFLPSLILYHSLVAQYHEHCPQSKPNYNHEEDLSHVSKPVIVYKNINCFLGSGGIENDVFGYGLGWPIWQKLQKGKL